MSLKVYFGNTLINEEYYTGLTNNFELFSDSFKLGSTPSNIYKLSIAKEGVTNQPSNVILKENNTTFAELEIDNIEEQDYTYSYDLTDKMLNLEFYYDASEIFVNGKTTLLAIAQDICSKAGLTLGTTNFRGYNKEISWYDNRRTAREYIGFIAELNGGFARVENSTLYFRKQKTSSVKTIDIDDCENFVIGEYHKITRVVYKLGAVKYEFGDETGNTLYLNSDNVFITEESEVQAIYNDIKNFEFYSFETGNCPIDYSVKAGDIITFTDGTNNYPTIAQYELEYFGTWIGGYSLSVNTERQEETKIVGNTEKIKNLQIIVDRDANTITQLVETTEEIEHQFETLQDIDGFAEGKYIYLDDASDELITSAKFNGETSQEGTPSPDYPSEIENLEGRNLFDENQLLEATGWTKNAEGYYTGTSGNLYAKFNLETNGFYFPQPFKTNTRYTLSWIAYTSSGTGTPRFRIYYTDNTYQDCANWNYTTPTKMFATSAENKTISKIIYTYGNNPGTIYLKDIQLEEGTVATSYEPYNSLEVKIINKNLFNKNRTQLGSNVTKTVLDTGVRVTTKVAGNARYCGIEIGKDELLGKTLTISSIMSASGTNGPCVRLFFGDATTPAKSVLGSTLTTSGSLTVTIPSSFPTGTDRIYLLMYSSLNSSEVGAYVDYTNLQVEIGDEATEYEEYKEQIVYFPLAEGQKLYEGSYLADDGIHNVRGQVVFDGSSDENWIKGSYPITGTAQMQIQKPANFFTETGATAVAKLNCSHFKSENQVVNGMAVGGMLNVYPSTDLNITTAAEFKTWLSNNPMTLEYPLAEEEIIPYNTEQQAAWNNIKSLHTYKTVTHIYSDAYAEIGYIKDNMLSDFETKASANVTKNDVSQLKIENGRISSEVSSTQSQFNNYYTKNEADNNTNSTKAELQNIIQQNKTEIEQTTQEIALRVNSIETNGVDKIETSMGYTFNNEGLNIDKEGAATASTIDNEAFKVKNKSANENVFFAGYVSDQDSAYRGQTIVESTNLVVKNYLNIEGASRFQPYVNPVLGGHGTGAFDIG